MRARLTRFLLVTSGLLIVAIVVPHGISQGLSQSESLGIEAVIPTQPPSSAPTITSPINGQAVGQLPTTVSGICQDGLLIKVFHNDVFAGSSVCQSGSYDIQIDLFVGQNSLQAFQSDSLDQDSPGSNTVVVSYNPPAAIDLPDRVTITSTENRIGADPGQNITWPITITGGVSPYAVAVDWGDGQTEIISLANPGLLELVHSYTSPGVYIVLVRVTDNLGTSSFMQLVAIANGQGANNEVGSDLAQTVYRQKLLVWPLYLLVPLIVTSFWLGRKHQTKIIKKKLDQGQAPFR